MSQPNSTPAPFFSKEQLIKLLLPSFLGWLIPLVVSFLFYNQQGELSIDYWLFKVIMAVTGLVTAYFLLRNFYKKYNYSWISNTIIFFVINVVLDLIVLVGFMKMDLGFYLLSIVPVYAVFMSLTNFGLYKLASKKS